MRSKERLKKVGIILGLAIFGAFLALVLLEGILAFIPSTSSDNDWIQYDPILGWRGKENFEGFSRGREWSLKFKLNSEGFRFKLPENQVKDSNVYRIAVLGDAFTLAKRISYNKTYWYLLKRKLNSLPRFNKKVEILNFGMSGYGTAQEYLVLKHYALKYKPDLVILLFYPNNDVLNNYRKLFPDTKRPYFTLNESNGLELIHSPAKSADKPADKSMMKRIKNF